MSLNSIAEVNLRRTVDISPRMGEVTSINDIIKESTAKATAEISAEKQDIIRMISSDNLDDPEALGLLQKSLLVYGNTVGFIGTAARKIVGTVETLLRSS